MNKDKKIIDAYIAKHGINPKKLEEYAKLKGIHINVMQELEHRALKKKMIEDLNLPIDFDLEKKENQLILQNAINNLSPEKKVEYLKRVN
jgi:hypothetical protein